MDAGARGMELLLLHEINAGTFARLYLAEIRGSGGLDRIVAVKLLREQWNEQQDIVNRTRDEARLLARLRHKNILRVEDLVEVDGQTAIIMEYVDGLDLKQLVDALRERRQRVPAKVALQITLEAASALEAAYFRIPTGMEAPLGVIHRDVKPSNIMLSVEGEVRVLDFGTARSSHIFRSAQTGAMRFGSLKYMSPERREGDRGEHAGDIYALGLVLLELLRTEWLPLLPMEVQEHDEAIAQAIARLDQLGMPNAEWDMTLRQALGQMLASEPSVRPTAEQVVKLMRAFVEQASGPVLDRFAHEVVTPLAKEVRGQASGGALAGRTLVVNAIGDPNRGMSPRSVMAPAPFSPPTRTAERPASERPPDRAVQPSPANSPDPRAISAGRAGSGPRAAPAADEGSNKTALAVGAGLFMVIGIAVVLLAIVVGVAVYLHNQPAGGPNPIPPPEPVPAPPPPPAPGPAPVPAPTPVAAASAHVKLAVAEDPVQWARLEAAGSTVVEGRGGLDADAPPGDYDLVVKLVGREPFRGSLPLGADGVNLECAADSRGNLKCTGGRRPLTLKP